LKVGDKNRKITRAQVEQVHEYALRLLEETGCTVLCEEALDILSRAGSRITDGGRVRIPRTLVHEALEAAPKEIEVFNRKGESAMVLRGWNSYYGTGSDCVNTIDLTSGLRRMCTGSDVEKLAGFCDALPNIDFVMSFGIAHDAPQGGNFVHQYRAMLLNTCKPIIVTGHGRNDMLTLIEMAAAAVGGGENLSARPPVILYTEPLSPLVHTEMGVSKGLLCCEYEVPFIYIGSPYMGATAPATLEGILVQAVAESLSGLVIFQNKCPGAKFIFGGDATVMDMQTTIFSYGAPELNILNACLADMAHYYELPFFCIAGSSDSKILDAQAGLEYGMSIYEATLNGCSIIHDCGYLESGLTSSFESVLLSDEIIGMVKYMLQPLQFNEDRVPLDVMKRVGPGGNFLMEDHTAINFKKRFWFPRFLDRKMWDGWKKSGSRDIRQVLNEKARSILSTHTPENLPDKTVRKIEAIVKKHKPDVV
jgi:trimethylamine--corrinoid protein Co-methyltransferase